jgi:hypothetical protein
MLDDHVRAASPEVAELVRGFVALVERCGPADVVATKTRYGFKVRMAFAALMPKRRWVDAHVVLARRRDDARFRLVEPEELDDEVLDWLREAYAIGRQEHLARR